MAKNNIISYVEHELRTLEERPLTEVDSLVLSQFSYLQLDGIVGGFEVEYRPVAVKDLYRAEYFSDLFPDNNSMEDNRSLLFAMAASPRFRDLELRYYVNEMDEEMEKQFSAVTIELDDESVYIAFRGTDSTLVGWKEDFNMAYISPVPSQISARAYVERVAEEWGGKMFLGGHSKGGNLAVYSAMSVREEIQDRIVSVYTHDGPGFNEDIMAASRYENIVDRVHKSLPQSSVVGMLLEQQEEYKVVESSTIGILQHNPFSWVVENGSFHEMEHLTKGAQKIDGAVQKWLSEMSREEREEFVEVLFSVLGAGEATTLSELNENWRTEILSMLRAMKELRFERKMIPKK